MVETVGIVGAGQMGSGIAHVLAINGIKVVLVDIDQGCLGRKSGRGFYDNSAEAPVPTR